MLEATGMYVVLGGWVEESSRPWFYYQYVYYKVYYQSVSEVGGKERFICNHSYFIMSF